MSSFKKRFSIYNTAAIFLFPALLFLLFYMGYPIFDSFRISTLEWNGVSPDKTFIGLKNWGALLKDYIFWTSFKNNIAVMFFSLFFQIPFALALATFLDVKGRGYDIFKIIWFLPLLMSSVAVGFLFKYTLDANFGIISYFLKLWGGSPIDLLGSPKKALYAVIGVICWQYIPFYMIYYLAGYSNLSQEIYDAATIDGASYSKYFWQVALPQLFPIIRSGAILSIVGSLKYFDLIYVMTEGGPGRASELMATYMYKNSFKTFQMGYGSTIASGMFILITLIALAVMKLLREENA